MGELKENVLNEMITNGLDHIGSFTKAFLCFVVLQWRRRTLHGALVCILLVFIIYMTQKKAELGRKRRKKKHNKRTERNLKRRVSRVSM